MELLDDTAFVDSVFVASDSDISLLVDVNSVLGGIEQSGEFLSEVHLVVFEQDAGEEEGDEHPSHGVEEDLVVGEIEEVLFDTGGVPSGSLDLEVFFEFLEVGVFSNLLVIDLQLSIEWHSQISVLFFTVEVSWFGKGVSSDSSGPLSWDTTFVSGIWSDVESLSLLAQVLLEILGIGVVSSIVADSVAVSPSDFSLFEDVAVQNIWTRHIGSVVVESLLNVAEHCVGFGDLLEGGVGFALGDSSSSLGESRVVLDCEGFVGFVDFLGGGIAGHTQDSVVVCVVTARKSSFQALGSHRSE